MSEEKLFTGALGSLSGLSVRETSFLPKTLDAVFIHQGELAACINYLETINELRQAIANAENVLVMCSHGLASKSTIQESLAELRRVSGPCLYKQQ